MTNFFLDKCTSRLELRHLFYNATNARQVIKFNLPFYEEFYLTLILYNKLMKLNVIILKNETIVLVII